MLASSLSRRSHWRPKDLRAGVTYLTGNVRIHLKAGSIDDLSATGRGSAIVLPANTSFTDDCITDKKSALGSFALTHFPERLEQFREAVREALPDPVGEDEAFGPQWPIGTTVLPEGDFGSPASLLITAATTRGTGTGIEASPASIAACIEGAFKASADRKIDHLRIPLLGTGHGGVTLKDALCVHVVTIEHLSRTHHHIRQVDIVVLDSAVPALTTAFADNAILVPTTPQRRRR